MFHFYSLVSDTLALLLSTGIRFVDSFLEFDVSLIPTSNIGCRVQFFIDGLIMLPSWIIVGITVERVFGTLYPQDTLVYIKRKSSPVHRFHYYTVDDISYIPRSQI